MKSLPEQLMHKVLVHTLALPNTSVLSDLKVQAEISLAGFEAEAKQQSIEACKKQSEKMFKEEVNAMAKAIQSSLRQQPIRKRGR